MQFLSVTGIVKEIRYFETGGHGGSTNCMQFFTVENAQGNIVNFLISPTTYFVHQEVIKKGDQIMAFYDANAPTPLIYPPQYSAVVVAKVTNQYFVKVSYFNEQLISEDGQLQLKLNRDTKAYLQNSQPFQGDMRNRNLIVLYGATTRSIPAQTAPYEVIVLCEV